MWNVESSEALFSTWWRLLLLLELLLHLQLLLVHNFNARRFLHVFVLDVAFFQELSFARLVLKLNRLIPSQLRSTSRYIIKHLLLNWNNFEIFVKCRILRVGNYLWLKNWHVCDILPGVESLV